MATEEEWINKLPSWSIKLLGIGWAVFIAWGITYEYNKSHGLNKAPRYTIGQVTRTDYVVGPSSHSVAFFTYTVGDSTYAKSSDGDIAEGCTRCLVKFAASDPTNFEFFNKICVPDSARQAPAAGWFYPPFPVPASVR